ncbi:hypothetical protein K438DRAFT_375168 [Mycena galopus ATCC 62051]|nr:hypothetical protein K438DRAFT_375168 [Mycena galopus ATCC 62051]
MLLDLDYCTVPPPPHCTRAPTHALCTDRSRTLTIVPYHHRPHYARNVSASRCTADSHALHGLLLDLDYHTVPPPPRCTRNASASRCGTDSRALHRSLEDLDYCTVPLPPPLHT